MNDQRHGQPGQPGKPGERGHEDGRGGAGGVGGLGGAGGEGEPRGEGGVGGAGGGGGRGAQGDRGPRGPKGEIPYGEWNRFRLMVGGAVVVLALGTGFNLKVQHDDVHRRCVETRDRAAAVAPALRGLVEAHRLDGDPHAVAIWQKYLDAAKSNPIPKC